MNVVCFLSECQDQPGVYAQKDDQERLYGVNDEHKEERVVRLYAVEYEHCLHGEMHGPAPFGVGTITAMLPTIKVTRPHVSPKCEVASKHWNVRK